jgi:hypothetical protein
MSGDELVPIELGHAEKALEKLGPRAEYLLVKDAAGFGHIAAGQTTAIWGNKVDELLKSMTPTNK